MAPCLRHRCRSARQIGRIGVRGPGAASPPGARGSTRTLRDVQSIRGMCGIRSAPRSGRTLSSCKGGRTYIARRFGLAGLNLIVAISFTFRTRGKQALSALISSAVNVDRFDFQADCPDRSGMGRAHRGRPRPVGARPRLRFDRTKAAKHRSVRGNYFRTIASSERLLAELDKSGPSKRGRAMLFAIVPSRPRLRGHADVA